LFFAFNRADPLETPAAIYVHDELFKAQRVQGAKNCDT